MRTTSPVCLLGCDALFERGLIVVVNGQIHMRIEARDDDRLKTLCRYLDGRRVSAFKSGRIPYFRWHANDHSNRSTSP